MIGAPPLVLLSRAGSSHTQASDRLGEMLKFKQYAKFLKRTINEL
jgi:hypothetical protein